MQKPKGLRRRAIALSGVLIVLAPGGWIAALYGWPHRGWFIACSLLSVCATIAAVGLMVRLAGVVAAALSAAQRGLAGEDQARMPPAARGPAKDEADELPSWFNRVLAALERSRRPHPTPARSASDGLTGLHGHRALHERLEEEIRRAERYDHVLSLLIIDIDNFRRLNEAQGYGFGDQVLREVGKALSGAIRNTDLPARYGGDEFAAVLPETAMEGALQAAAKIRTEVTRRTAQLSQGAGGSPFGTAGVTVSVGAASFPQHSTRKDGLVIAADVAMYMAKHSGGNKVCPFHRVPGAKEVTDPYQLYQFLQNSDWGALGALVAAVDARDRITGDHSKKVAAYSVALARAIGLSEADVEALRTAALLHDVGKIGITDRVLVKNGKLTSDERALIESHPGVGEALARRSLRLAAALPGILYHHERYDGGGYPVGLAGEDIPVPARIIAIADAYDAMISPRHYRTPPGPQRARRELELGSSQQWDPELVRVFLRLEAEGLLESEQLANLSPTSGALAL